MTHNPVNRSIQYPASSIYLLPLTGLCGKNQSSGRSAAWIAHLPWAQGVGGSNPLAPTILSLDWKVRIFRLNKVKGGYENEPGNSHDI